MNEILTAEHLNKYFHEPEDFQVLKDVSLSVKKGEFVSLIGKSGSGKSTLLYLLSTLDTDYEGSITINGTKVTGQTQNELAKFRNENLGFVFQFHYLLPEFTVLQNVMMPARKLGKYSVREIEARALEKLKLMDMDAFAGRGPLRHPVIPACAGRGGLALRGPRVPLHHPAPPASDGPPPPVGEELR